MCITIKVTIEEFKNGQHRQLRERFKLKITECICIVFKTIKKTLRKKAMRFISES